MKLFKNGKRPIKPGTYWFRPKGYTHTRIVSVWHYETDKVNLFTNENFGISIKNEMYNNGTWIGPLPTMEELEKKLMEREDKDSEWTRLDIIKALAWMD